MAQFGETRATTAAGAGSVPVDPFGRMFSPAELAKLWHLSEQSIRRLFQDRADVFKLGAANPRGKRGYQTLRIPEAVAARVFQERCR